MNTVKKETKRHADAFAFYLSLGKAKRSYLKVARQFKVSEQAVRKWGKSFEWQKRIAKADKKIVESTQEKAIKYLCENRDWLKKAKNTILEKAIADIVTLKEEGKFIPAKHIKPVWEMVKTELGEPSNISTNNIKPDVDNPIEALFVKFFSKK